MVINDCMYVINELIITCVRFDFFLKLHCKALFLDKVIKNATLF